MPAFCTLVNLKRHSYDIYCNGKIIVKKKRMVSMNSRLIRNPACQGWKDKAKLIRSIKEGTFGKLMGSLQHSENWRCLCIAIAGYSQHYPAGPFNVHGSCKCNFFLGSDQVAFAGFVLLWTWGSPPSSPPLPLVTLDIAVTLLFNVTTSLDILPFGFHSCKK